MISRSDSQDSLLIRPKNSMYHRFRWSISAPTAIFFGHSALRGVLLDPPSSVDCHRFQELEALMDHLKRWNILLFWYGVVLLGKSFRGMSVLFGIYLLSLGGLGLGLLSGGGFSLSSASTAPAMYFASSPGIDVLQSLAEGF